ncbi:hypothetical protein PsYK624_075140 [Phanerochaete sordida]|uniref:Transmembrane protein n=1 Tax=Phanerochaete sordida TaxID=48140 RepID=A0A9P3GBK7_9APHY|nr:hypothetical protein PsYK624_075140 [Phanerochaete sordida]
MTTMFTTAAPGSARRRTSEEHVPGEVRYTDYAEQDVYVATPKELSRSGTGASANAPGGPSGTRRWTQEDQNRKDEEARNKAVKELVNSWMERLQLISVITTFFAAIEAQLLGIVTPSGDDGVSGITKASAATLSSALVVHSFAAILSFIAAFFLVRFRVHEANKQETKAEQKLEAGPKPGQSAEKPGPTVPPEIWSANPRLEQVGPLRRGKPPVHLLENCHTLCMVLSLVGFVLAMVGIMCYVWAMLPRSSIVLSTVAIGLSVMLSAMALSLPQSVSLMAPSHVVDSS